MVGVLILTHGPLARELLAAARRIAGACDGLEALCLDWDESRERAEQRVRSALDRRDQGDGVLVLTDLFGGTPHNIASCLCAHRRVVVVSGVNLPMVLRLGCSETGETRLDDLARSVSERGRGSIQLCAAEGGEGAALREAALHEPKDEPAICTTARGARK